MCEKPWKNEAKSSSFQSRDSPAFIFEGPSNESGETEIFILQDVAKPTPRYTKAHGLPDLGRDVEALPPVQRGHGAGAAFLLGATSRQLSPQLSPPPCFSGREGALIFGTERLRVVLYCPHGGLALALLAEVSRTLAWPVSTTELAQGAECAREQPGVHWKTPRCDTTNHNPGAMGLVAWELEVRVTCVLMSNPLSVFSGHSFTRVTIKGAITLSRNLRSSLFMAYKTQELFHSHGKAHFLITAIS